MKGDQRTNALVIEFLENLYTTPFLRCVSPWRWKTRVGYLCGVAVPRVVIATNHRAAHHANASRSIDTSSTQPTARAKGATRFTSPILLFRTSISDVLSNTCQQGTMVYHNSVCKLLLFHSSIKGSEPWTNESTSTETSLGFEV